MKAYADYLKKQKYNVTYIEHTYTLPALIKSLRSKYDQINLIDPVDNLIMNKWIDALDKSKITFSIIQTQNFLLNWDDMNEYHSKFVKKSKYFHDRSFYPWMRKKLNVLMSKDGKPLGGKWSFDKENRESIKADTITKLPTIPKPIKNKYITEAKKYVENHFGDNYGETDNMIYPIDYTSSLKWLKKFINERLTLFGKYQDTVHDSNPFMFHSVISPMLNIGLLTDTIVLNEVLKHTSKVPMNSLEGFIRQLIGWRNYVRLVYHFEGDKMRKMNHFKHKNKLNEKWWTGTTGIDPIDHCINQSLKWCYIHHIQRLMYMGNIMLLCQIDPNDVYKWFMEIHSIDAYDVFMVPNIYGMSQYADGGMMMTRPYFSGSNYVLKMSTFEKGAWADKWDALYYGFINKHQNVLKKIYSTAMMVKAWERKSDNEQKELLRQSKLVINELVE
jgi:deoxyribodipyrimidine photolyase-related protein